jgi:hypothetical protein
MALEMTRTALEAQPSITLQRREARLRKRLSTPKTERLL